MQPKQKRWKHTGTQPALRMVPMQMGHRASAAASDCPAGCIWLGMALTPELLCSRALLVPNASSCQKRCANCLSFCCTRNTRAKQTKESGGRGEMRVSQRAVHECWKAVLKAASAWWASQPQGLPSTPALASPRHAALQPKTLQNPAVSPRQPPPAQGTYRRCSGKVQQVAGRLQWCRAQRSV